MIYEDDLIGLAQLQQVSYTKSRSVFKLQIVAQVIICALPLL